MTLEEIIYDILEIKGALEDDHDIEPNWLLYKINNYRSIFIEQDFAIRNEINPQWLQKFYRHTVSKTNSADDPAIELTSITIGKLIIPELISLPEDLGLYRVTGSSGIMQFQPIDFNTLMMKIECNEEKMGEYGYCSRIGTTLYIYPLCMEVQALLLAKNPLEVQINDNGTLRTPTYSDSYPIDPLTAQRIIMEILTKDLALQERAITDITNDSQMQLKILKDEMRKPTYTQ